MESDYVFDQILDKVQAALDGGEHAWSVQSTGERLAVAVLLDKPDWIKSMGYSLGGAITRIGPEWLARFPEVREVLDLP